MLLPLNTCHKKYPVCFFSSTRAYSPRHILAFMNRHPWFSLTPEGIISFSLSLMAYHEQSPKVKERGSLFKRRLEKRCQLLPGTKPCHSGSRSSCLNDDWQSYHGFACPLPHAIRPTYYDETAMTPCSSSMTRSSYKGNPTTLEYEPVISLTLS